MTKRFETSDFSRRKVLGLAFGAGAALGLARFGIAPAMATPKGDAAIAKILGGKTPKEGGIKLDVPEIAENGNTVPVGFSVDSPMTKDNYVKKVYVLADGNPSPLIASFEFTPMSGKASASTRMRLAKTQNIIAIAEMSDGSLAKVSSQVKVTIGGCGG